MIRLRTQMAQMVRRAIRQNVHSNSPHAHGACRVRAKAHDLFEVPRTWSQLIEPSAGRAVELEVGSGKGLFLEQASLSRPEHYFIGIELSGKFANRAAERLDRSHVPQRVHAAW